MERWLFSTVAEFLRLAFVLLLAGSALGAHPLPIRKQIDGDCLSGKIHLVADAGLEVPVAVKRLPETQSPFGTEARIERAVIAVGAGLTVGRIRHQTTFRGPQGFEKSRAITEHLELGPPRHQNAPPPIEHHKDTCGNSIWKEFIPLFPG
jgi:hypothetical protein